MQLSLHSCLEFSIVIRSFSASCTFRWNGSTLSSIRTWPAGPTTWHRKDPYPATQLRLVVYTPSFTRLLHPRWFIGASRASGSMIFWARKARKCFRFNDSVPPCPKSYILECSLLLPETGLVSSLKLTAKKKALKLERVGQEDSFLFQASFRRLRFRGRCFITSEIHQQITIQDLPDRPHQPEKLSGVKTWIRWVKLGSTPSPRNIYQDYYIS